MWLFDTRRYGVVRNIVFMAILLCTGVRALGATYYIDAEHGSDTNSGATPEMAWRSVEKASGVILKPGDQLLFHAGDSFTGVLEIRGAGYAGHPIVIGEYGEGAKPKLLGAGAPYALLLQNVQFVEVENLDISDRARGSGTRNGVLVEADQGQVIHHVYLYNLDVHDVSGELGTDVVEKNTGGIGFQANSNANPSRFDDIRVDHCRITHVDSTAIWLQGETGINPRSPDWAKYRFTDVRITQNYLSDIGKNAIIVRDSLAPLIDGNTIRGSAMKLHGNSIMVSYSEGAIISHNDVSGVQYGGMEGAAFDSDYDTVGTVIEYNYAHDDGGGLVDICAPKHEGGFNDGTIVRYNIVDDAKNRVFSFDDPATNAMIYNNSVFLSGSDKPHILRLHSFERSSAENTGVVFANNIIINEGDSDNEYAAGKRYLIVANCFAGRHAAGEPPDPRKITANPKFVKMPPDPARPEKGFALRPDSPCARSGVTIPNNGGVDFLGNPIPSENPDRGAIESTADGAPK